MIEPLNPEADGYVSFNDWKIVDDNVQLCRENIARLERVDENEVVTLAWRNATLIIRAGTAIALNQLSIEEYEQRGAA